MKKYNISNNQYKWIIFLSIFCCISFLLNYLYGKKNNINEGFKSCKIPTNELPRTNKDTSGFNWNYFLNNTQNNINNLTETNNPKGYFANSNSICSFPDCNVFSGVENNWNQNIVNKDKRNNTTSINTEGNYRVVTRPYDFLKFNIISPNCCQYTTDYTSGSGCACLTQQQKQLIDFRYGNRS